MRCSTVSADRFPRPAPLRLDQAVPKVDMSKLTYRQIENHHRFLTAIKGWGVPPQDCYDVTALCSNVQASMDGMEVERVVHARAGGREGRQRSAQPAKHPVSLSHPLPRHWLPAFLLLPLDRQGGAHVVRPQCHLADE